MNVRELIEALRRLPTSELSSAQQQALSDLLTKLAPLEDMDLTGFFALLTPAKRKSRSQPGAAVPRANLANGNTHAIASSLRDVFNDDTEFPAALRDIASSRSVTIQTLKDVFAELFERDGGFRSKVTKAAIVQKIIAERNIVVRDGKMAQMLGRKPAHAD